MKSNNTRVLHWSRFLAAVFCLLIAAGHLAYTIPASAGSGFGQSTHISNSTNSTTHAPPANFNSFNMLGFWFDVEVITYTIIAVVFLLGLRSWYIPSVLFNILNICLYFLTFGSHFNFVLALSTINIIVFGWILFLITGLLLLKYDPGSELDKLLVTKKA